MNCQLCLRDSAKATTTTASGLPACDDCHGLDWWHCCANISALYRWLAENGGVDTTRIDDVEYLIQKPWKWTAEYREMMAQRAIQQAAGRPVPQSHEARS